MNNIIYIHGVGGHNSSKANKLSSIGNVIVPKQNPYSPISTARSIYTEHYLNSKQSNILVGSSRGGLIALYLSIKYNLPAIFLNPSVCPSVQNKNIYGYKCGLELDEMSEYVTDNAHLLRKDNLAILSKNDEVLDYTQTDMLLDCHKIYIEDNHKISNFDKLIPQIEQHIQSLL